MPKVDSVIVALNAIDVGPLDSVLEELHEVRGELERRELGELVEKLDECIGSLRRGDLKNFRRLKETIVSRLGHLR